WNSPHRRCRVEEWQLLVRDDQLAHIGVVDDELELEVIDRHLGLGAWRVVVDARSPSAELLRTGEGILLVTSSGETLLSGPTRPSERQRDVGSDTITFTGVSDPAALRRLSRPRPAPDLPGPRAPQP